MGVIEDCKTILRQEAELVLPHFHDHDAWTLGCWLRERAEIGKLPVVIDVRRFDRPLFYAAMLGSTPDNSEWVRRKSNVVQRFHRSSYGVGRDLELAGKTLIERYGLSETNHAPHGGSFPLNVRGVGIIGSITVSGLPQREDHALVVTCLADACGINAASLAFGDT